MQFGEVFKKLTISKIYFGLACLVFEVNQPAYADTVETKVEYKDGDSKLIGFEYSDSEITAPTPGVLIFSDWMGISDFSKEQAQKIVDLGYRAFIVDIYGDGKLAADAKEAGGLATKFKSDRPLLRKRAQLGLETFLKNKKVLPESVGAIGFCFGGTAALELARTGAPLAAVVSFHGGLDTPDPKIAKNIKARLLVLHGADDPYVSEEEVKGFEQEMRQAEITWELTKYSNAVHAFTNSSLGSDNSKGAAYNAVAARRAFAAMDEFLGETLEE